MSMLPSDLFQKVHRIQIASAHLAKSILAGAYRSAFKGRGMEFEEVREYQPTDDVRNIDWNVTARMNHPYVKNFREERDLTVILVVDVSASTRFGGLHGLKSTLIAEISAVLAFSAIRNNDRIGLLLFSDIVEKYLPPQKGTRHVLRIIRELLAFQPTQKKSDLKVALNFLGRVQTKSSICFLISDFLFPPCVKEMAVTAAKNDLIAMMILDANEFHLPELGLTHFQDLESGTRLLVDTSETILKTEDHQKEIKLMMSKIGADLVHLRTDQSYVPALRKFFKIREERKR